jgi:outer membrane protein assembly factor BamB
MWFESAKHVARKMGLKSNRARRPRRAFSTAIERLKERKLLSGVDVVTGDPQDWAMFNRDSEGSRHNFAEHILSPESVGELAVKWTFDTAGPIAGTPAVVNDRVYTADATGEVYALDRNGQLLWQTTLNVGPTISGIKVNASALVTNRTVIIGDQSGQVHGLDVETGAVKWTTNPNPHPFAAVWGSPTMVLH